MNEGYDLLPSPLVKGDHKVVDEVPFVGGSSLNTIRFTSVIMSVEWLYALH